MSFVHGHDQRNRYSHWSPLRDAVPAGPGFEIPNRRPTTSLILQPHRLRAERPTTFAEAVRKPTHFLNHSSLGAARIGLRHLGWRPNTASNPDMDANIRVPDVCISGFRTAAQAHPTTLEAWDALLDTVSIARQLGAEWILPTSFYRICQSSFDHEIVTGTELSDADKVTCFAAMPLELYAEDPADVCLGCVSDMKMLHDEAREELWDDLPRIFGLGDWENWRQ
ncbi:hypothetical protein B0H14DRAFT_3142601 [Mycena olivaceomarginata]|nr:hypothetical protein B0H14DRAFT_3142601 [Mycena olivaceomarginata]